MTSYFNFFRGFLAFLCVISLPLALGISCTPASLRQEFQETQQKNSSLYLQQREALAPAPASLSEIHPPRQEMALLLEAFMKEPPRALPFLRVENENIAFREGEVWSLERLAAEILRKNRKIQAKKEASQAVQDRYPQALELMQVVQAYESYTRDIEQSLPLSAFFPYPSSLVLKGKLIRHQQELAYLEWQKTIRDQVFLGKMLYAELMELQGRIQLTQESLELLTLLEQTERKRYKAGLLSQSELIPIQVQHRETQNELFLLQEKIHSLYAQLYALLDWPSSESRRVFTPLTLPSAFPEASDLEKRALKTRQEILMARENKALVETLLASIKREAFPTWTEQSESLKDTRSPRVEQEEAKAGEEFLWSTFGLNFAFLRELEKQSHSFEEMIFEEENLAKSEIALRSFDWKQQFHTEKLYREELIPQLLNRRTQVKTSYFNGSLPFTKVLEVDQEVLKMQFQQLKALRQGVEVWFYLEKNEGRAFSSFQSMEGSHE
jgi:hypothetical protein